MYNSSEILNTEYILVVVYILYMPGNDTLMIDGDDVCILNFFNLI